MEAHSGDYKMYDSNEEDECLRYDIRLNQGQSGLLCNVQTLDSDFDEKIKCLSIEIYL